MQRLSPESSGTTAGTNPKEALHSSTISDINSFLLLIQRVIELPKLLKSEKFCGYAAVRDQLLNNCWHKVI
jgi:hypothetical protein